jgi:hypothetical protein
MEYALPDILPEACPGYAHLQAALIGITGIPMPADDGLLAEAVRGALGDANTL